MTKVELGLGVESWSSPIAEIPIERIRLAESLGYHSVWTAEAFGADALVPLAHIAAHTKRIGLAAGLLQISARPAVTAAMSLAALAHLAPGRQIIAGLGVSGPQVVEGWYGLPWGKPITRLREYVAVMRQAIARAGPISLAGEEIQLPYRGPGSSGLGKPLKPILHTPKNAIEIWPAGGGPRAVRQAAEIGDGWLPMGFRPGMMETRYAEQLAAGFERRGDDDARKSFKIWPILPVALCNDVAAELEAMKPAIAFLVGGYGARGVNFHMQQMARCGFVEAAERIQDLWMDGHRDEAVRSVPEDYVDATRLVGPPERIRERWPSWAGAGATGYTIYTQSDEAMALLAELAGTRD